jgi:poly(A)-specific ribonuclease
MKQLFNSEMGFSLVAQLIVDARKPIIGHNMIYDIAFFYHQFIAPLPKTYEEFSKSVHEKFPIFYDTKALSCDI